MDGTDLSPNITDDTQLSVWGGVRGQGSRVGEGLFNAVTWCRGAVDRVLRFGFFMELH